MVTITGEYQGDLHCVAVHGPSGGTLNTDAPKDNEGRGETFSPTDLLATSLATCMVTTMAIVARRHGTDLKGLRYQVTKEMTTGGPRRIARLAVDLWMPEAAKRLPEGLMERTALACPVHLSLSDSVDKRIEFHWE